jgi:hypothetical protein
MVMVMAGAKTVARVVVVARVMAAGIAIVVG